MLAIVSLIIILCEYYAYAYGELVGMVTGAINYSKALVM